mmetsp:Transcript_94090/g.287883  ORF Transcript_94090/g.287883 Transcript_94090/m.287883 type:complete len:234 (-) Transcript_94090:58-759(-)
MASAMASSGLAETVEERLFAAIRREVLPYAQEKERDSFTREIWMLEEELENGHPFFSKRKQQALSKSFSRQSSLGGGTPAAALTRTPTPARAAAFEAEVTQALLGARCKEAHTDEDDFDAEESVCSTDVPEVASAQPPSPELELAKDGKEAPEFWLPVFRRCLSFERDMTARGRLVQAIHELEEIVRFPSGHDLASRCALDSPQRARVHSWSSAEEEGVGNIAHSVSWRRFDA